MGEQREESLGELGPETPPGQVMTTSLKTFSQEMMCQVCCVDVPHLSGKNMCVNGGK